MSERRVTVVTGGASGIGHAAAVRFARGGDFVVLADLNEAGAGSVLDEIRTAGGDGAFARLDVADEAAVDAAAAAIEQAHGPVGALVNSAGILQNPQRLEDFSMAEHDRVWDVDYRGTYLCCRAFGLRMAGRRRGAIVNIASVSGMRSLPLLAYAPAKSAVIALTATLGVELGRSGVRVNAVSPGVVLTPIQRKNFEDGVRDPTRMKVSSAMNRLVLPEEIADGCFFLCSDQATAITGINLPIDCGWLGAESWHMMGGVPHVLNG